MLFVDIETYSATDLKAAGVYRYVEDPDFEILMAAWALDDGPVRVAIGREEIENIPGLFDPWTVKMAHNAQFERICFSAFLGLPCGQYRTPDEWLDSAALASSVGLPRSLENLAKALGAEEKDSAGTRLINLFSKPNRKGARTTAEDEPEKWAEFVEYCRQDVETMRDIYYRLPRYEWLADERAIWLADQHINDLGVKIDQDLARDAVAAEAENHELAKRELCELLGIENAGSVPQLTQGLSRLGLDLPDLRQATVAEALEGELTDAQRRALQLRQELALVASKKYNAALNAVCSDGRLRGQFLYYGAHTGRWSSRGIQVQNLPRASIEHPEAAILDLALGNGADAITIKSLVRSMLVGPFTVVDYSAIEARVLAWVCGEQWAIDAFAAGRDIYVETAKRMGGLTRQQGKVAVLALGYNGGVNSLRNMGAQGSDDKLQGMVRQWRKANPRIVRAWRLLETAFRQGGKVGRLRVEADGADRHLVLPSGRPLIYRNVKGVQRITFSDPRGHRADTYGGRLMENCLAAGTPVLTERGWLPIEQVTTERVWDGDNWVRHDGLLPKGEQATIEVDGVRMTPDHLVLTRGGWNAAAQCEGLDRADVRVPDGHEVPGFERQEIAVGSDLRVRDRAHDGNQRRQAGQILRVQDKRTDEPARDYARDVEPPRVPRVTDGESPLHAAVPPGVEKLRRARNRDVQRVGAVVRAVLGRHGADVPAGSVAGPGGQRRELRALELPLGLAQTERPQHPSQSAYRHPMGADDCGGSQRAERNRRHHPALPAGPRSDGYRVVRETRPAEQVYDLLNCGPQSRFTVWSEAGPMIVHNCVQAISRDLLALALVRLVDEGYPVALHVHDEVVVDGEHEVETIAKVMCSGPPWADELPLNAEGFRTYRYRKG